MNQKDVAESLDPGVDQATVARWESGARRIPPGLWQALAYLDRAPTARLLRHLQECHWIAGTLSGKAADDLRVHLDGAIATVIDILDLDPDPRNEVPPPEYARRGG